MDNELVESGRKEIYCIECGEKVPDGLRFCVNCGTPVNRNALASSDKNLILCPACNLELPIGMRFCTNCGTKIGIVAGELFDECPNCGAVAKKGHRFCTECGESFDKITSTHISSALNMARSKRKNQRKTEEDREIINEDLSRRMQEVESKFLDVVDEIIGSASSIFKTKSGRNRRLNRKK
ncbi:MAG: zinc ribbon domain-containing protein [Methanothermobacter sp.]|nr:zinc ribbon domain-containing protein [Methanothermobacter sp.]